MSILVPPLLLVKETLILLDNLPWQLKGELSFESHADVAINPYDLGGNLDSMSDRYLSYLAAALVQNKDYELTGKSIIPSGMSRQIVCWHAFSLTFGWMYDQACDQFVLYVDSKYTPEVPLRSVPLYHWLGEMAEAA